GPSGSGVQSGVDAVAHQQMVLSKGGLPIALTTRLRGASTSQPLFRLGQPASSGGGVQRRRWYDVPSRSCNAGFSFFYEPPAHRAATDHAVGLARQPRRASSGDRVALDATLARLVPHPMP